MNFRGSRGFGYDHLEAGLGAWGTQTHNDITDATRWAIIEGLATEGSICIVGASFGGYAALMGAALEPDLYQCAVAFAPVSSLTRFLKTSRRYANPELLEKAIGTNRRALKSMSPDLLAENFLSPVLLMHGEKDRVVDVVHSRRMADALRAERKSFEYEEFEGGDHHLSRESNRKEALDHIRLICRSI